MLSNYGLVIILGLVFGLQIVMVVPLSIGIITTPISIAYRAGISGLSVLLLSILLSKITTVKFEKGYLFLVLFYIIYSLRLIYDNSIIGVEVSKVLQSTTHIYLFAILNTLLPLIGFLILNNKIHPEYVANKIFWIAAIQSVAIAYIFFYLFGVTIDALSSRYLVMQAIESDNGLPINPIIIGRSGGFLILASLIKKSRNSWFLIVRFGFIALGILLLVLGASRGPLVACLVSIMTYIVFYFVHNKKDFKWMYMFGSLSLLLFAIGIIIVQNFEKWNISLINRIIRSFDTNSVHQGAERLDTWSAAWNQFLSSPIFGDCFVENFTFTYPHNLVLEVLMSVGLLGFIPFLLSLIYTSIRGWKIAKAGYPTIFFLFLYSFISILFSGSIFFSPEFWVTMALIFVVKIPKA